MKMTQNDYKFEAAEKCKSPELSDQVLMTPLSEITTVCAEAAYRRGYYQGFGKALDEIMSGQTEGALEDFLYRELHNWRCDNHSGKFKEPPDPK